MLVDTHVHFDDLVQREPAGAIIERAIACGVNRMVAVGGSARGNEIALQVANEHRENVRAAIGFDRHQAGINIVIDDFEQLLEKNKPAAIGEIGLDFHREHPDRDAQIILFRTMLAIARKYCRPVIVHNRDADNETIGILNEHARLWPGPKDNIGVCHCFTGSEKTAGCFLELGFYISFSGILTFLDSRAGHENRARLIKAVRLVPDSRLLIETDSPFLAPKPLRGKTNEPANVRYVAQALAEIRGCPIESIAAITTKNAERLFFNET